MNYAVALLEERQTHLRAIIQEAKSQLADVNDALEKLGGNPLAKHVPPAAKPIPPQTVPQPDVPPFVASESEAEERPTEPFHPDGDRAARGDDNDTPPWDQPDEPAPAEPTSGRRTNAQIAAEHGVDLKDVKKWNDEHNGGGRVTKGDIEKYAALVRSGGPAAPAEAPAAPEQVQGQQSIDDFEDGDAVAETDGDGGTETYEPPF